jgi:hypothetical protein
VQDRKTEGCAEGLRSLQREVFLTVSFPDQAVRTVQVLHLIVTGRFYMDVVRCLNPSKNNLPKETLKLSGQNIFYSHGGKLPGKMLTQSEQEFFSKKIKDLQRIF